MGGLEGGGENTNFPRISLVLSELFVHTSRHIYLLLREKCLLAGNAKRPFHLVGFPLGTAVFSFSSICIRRGNNFHA